MILSMEERDWCFALQQPCVNSVNRACGDCVVSEKFVGDLIRVIGMTVREPNISRGEMASDRLNYRVYLTGSNGKPAGRIYFSKGRIQPR